MKTKSILLTALFVAAGAVTTLAFEKEARREIADLSTMKVIPAKEEGVFKVFYRGGKSGKVRLEILSASGKLVHSESFKNTSGFVRPYNLSNLSEGEYTIVLTDEFGKQIEKVNLAKPASAAIIASVIELAEESDKFVVVVPKQGEETINIKIFNANNELLISNDIKASGDYSGLYNLKKVASSSYTFEISSKSGLHQTFTHRGK